MAQLNANLSNYEVQEGFDVLLPGYYLARIADSEIKQGPKGPYINWTFEIEGKPNKVWEVMSLGSDVSLKRLKTLAQCAGHQNPNYIDDTEELHGMRVMVRLKIEKSDEYGDKNKITAFKSPEGSKPAKATPTPAASSPETPKVIMPWEK